MTLLDSQIWPGSSGCPGSISSSPVEMTVTRGRGRACTLPSPAAASRPSCTGPIRDPAGSSRSPGTASPPRRRIEEPADTASRTVTRSVSPSVSSTGTTASAPPGMAAPVMIRMQVPGVSSRLLVSPAAISPSTGSVTGVPALAPATSRASTA